MKVLYITTEFLAPDTLLRIKNEGNDTYLAIKDEVDTLKGTIKRIPFESRFEFIKKLGKEDLIIYDDKFQGEPSRIRKAGYSVIGGDKKTDRLELDRIFANQVAETCGMLVPKVHAVQSLKEAKSFLQKEKGKWVLKQQGKLDGIKGLNYVSKMDNSEDLIAYLDWLENRWLNGVKQEFILQEKIEGHEFACGSYWNGHEFQKDAQGNEICEENWEHKPLMSGNLGESTEEQYTVMRYLKADDSNLFQDTLDKFRPLLKKIDYRGDFDINTIVNEKGAYFLEFTPRMGNPASSGQIAIQKTPWGEFLKSVADGKQVADFQYNKGYCIVSWLYTKPFPAMKLSALKKLADKFYDNNKKELVEAMNYKLNDSQSMPVMFKEKLTEEELKNIHFDGVMMDKGLKVGNTDGFVLTATGMGQSVDEAAEKLEALLQKIIVPKGFYRNDFKNSNYHKSREDLTKWGYLKEDKSFKDKVLEILK